MAVHIKQRETQGNEVLTSEVITPGAATLYPCRSHPSSFGSFFCSILISSYNSMSMAGVWSPPDKWKMYSCPLKYACGNGDNYVDILRFFLMIEGIKSSLRGMNTRFLDWFKKRGTSQTDIKACVACQDERWGNSFREGWVSNKRMSSVTTGESHLMLT